MICLNDLSKTIMLSADGEVSVLYESCEIMLLRVVKSCGFTFFPHCKLSDFLPILWKQMTLANKSYKYKAEVTLPQLLVNQGLQIHLVKGAVGD